MSREADRKLDEVARRNHGVFTWRQAVDAGVPGATISRRTQRGRYRKLQPGVYAVAGAPDTLDARLLAAALAAGSEAVLSHESAAHLWGIGEVPRRIHLTTLQRRPTGLRGVVVHRTKRLPPHHVNRNRRVPVTSVARTICDVASLLDVAPLRTLIGEAVRRRLVDADDIRCCLDELGRVRGAARLREILAELSPQEARSRSEMESLYLRVTMLAGLPEPILNHPVRDVFGTTRLIDAVYPAQGVAVELDGQAFHGLSTDRRDDNARQNALVLAGWRRFLRFSWLDLTRDSWRVVEEVRLALQAGESGGE